MTDWQNDSPSAPVNMTAYFLERASRYRFAAATMHRIANGQEKFACQLPRSGRVVTMCGCLGFDCHGSDRRRAGHGRRIDHLV